jgi:hypothetical protein
MAEYRLHWTGKNEIHCYLWDFQHFPAPTQPPVQRLTI